MGQIHPPPLNRLLLQTVVKVPVADPGFQRIGEGGANSKEEDDNLLLCIKIKISCSAEGGRQGCPLRSGNRFFVRSR